MTPPILSRSLKCFSNAELENKYLTAFNGVAPRVTISLGSTTFICLSKKERQFIICFL